MGVQASKIKYPGTNSDPMGDSFTGRIEPKKNERSKVQRFFESVSVFFRGIYDRVSSFFSSKGKSKKKGHGSETASLNIEYPNIEEMEMIHPKKKFPNTRQP